MQCPINISLLKTLYSVPRLFTIIFKIIIVPLFSVPAKAAQSDCPNRLPEGGSALAACGHKTETTLNLQIQLLCLTAHLFHLYHIFFPGWLLPLSIDRQCWENHFFRIFFMLIKIEDDKPAGIICQQLLQILVFLFQTMYSFFPTLLCFTSGTPIFS